jgi:hypothetical protein
MGADDSLVICKGPVTTPGLYYIRTQRRLGRWCLDVWIAPSFADQRSVSTHYTD